MCLSVHRVIALSNLLGDASTANATLVYAGAAAPQLSLASNAKPVLLSSSDHWAMHSALNSVAVHWCWVTAHLHEEGIFTGVFTVIQA